MDEILSCLHKGSESGNERMDSTALKTGQQLTKNTSMDFTSCSGALRDDVVSVVDCEVREFSNFISRLLTLPRST